MQNNINRLFNMKYIIYSAIKVIFAVMVYAQLLSSQTTNSAVAKKQISGMHANDHQRSLSELTQAADVIASGKVIELIPEWDENRSSIRTVVKISTDETIKGTSSDNSLTVVIPGGEIDGVGEWYSHSVQFQKDEDVVVFCKKDKKGHYRVSEGERGKFTVLKENNTGNKIIKNLGSLESFKSEIKNVMKAKYQDSNK